MDVPLIFCPQEIYLLHASRAEAPLRHTYGRREAPNVGERSVILADMGGDEIEREWVSEAVAFEFVRDEAKNMPYRGVEEHGACLVRHGIAREACFQREQRISLLRVQEHRVLDDRSVLCSEEEAQESDCIVRVLVDGGGQLGSPEGPVLGTGSGDGLAREELWDNVKRTCLRCGLHRVRPRPSRRYFPRYYGSMHEPHA